MTLELEVQGSPRQLGRGGQEKTTMSAHDVSRRGLVCRPLTCVATALTAAALTTGAIRCWGAEANPRGNRAVLRVCRIGDQPAVAFAGQELERYLRRMSGATVVHMPRRSYAPEAETLWVGCFADFPRLEHPSSQDPELDDAIVVQVERRRGIISGANPRAVLIAAYRYLTELGCRWVRPGREGERVTFIDDPLAQTISLAESPSYRHRGVCFEGASSCEHVLEFIDWSPKVGLNTYFTEYFDGYIFSALSEKRPIGRSSGRKSDLHKKWLFHHDAIVTTQLAQWESQGWRTRNGNARTTGRIGANGWRRVCTLAIAGDCPCSWSAFCLPTAAAR